MSRLPFGSLRSALTHHEIPLSSALELVLPKEKNQDRVTYVCELNVTYVSDRTNKPFTAFRWLCGEGRRAPWGQIHFEFPNLEKAWRLFP